MSVDRMTITVRDAKDDKILYRDVTEAPPGQRLTGVVLPFDVGFGRAQYIVEVDVHERDDQDPRLDLAEPCTVPGCLGWC